MENQKKERCLVIVKPDGIQRTLIGELITRIERTGLKLVAMKMNFATEDQCWSHYNKDDAWFLEKGELTISKMKERGMTPEKEAIEYGKDIMRGNVSFMTCGPIIPMIWEGNQSVGIIKKLVGGTEPLTSDVGTIRGDLTLDSYDLANIGGRAVRNLIHCSDKPEEGEREIKVWFSDDEILKYTLVQEKMLYDINLDGIRE